VTVSFVNEGGTADTTTNGASLTLDMPIGLAADDLLVVFNVAKWNTSGYGAGPWNTPSGWTALPEFSQVGTFDSSETYVQQVFYKVAGSSEPAVTITQSGSASGPRWRSVVMAWRGVANPERLYAEQEWQYNATAPTTIVPAGSTALPGLLVMFSMQAGVSGVSPGYDNDNGFIQRSPGTFSGSFLRGGVGSIESHPGGAVVWPTFDQGFARDWLFTKLYLPKPSSGGVHLGLAV